MSPTFSCRRLFSHYLSLTGLAFFSFGAITHGLAQTTLEARLVPSVMISGPVGSLQQIQYSTNLADPNAWTILSHVRLDAPSKPFYDENAAGAKRFYRTKIVGVADTNLVWIPPGTFLMGSPENETGRVATATSGSGAEGPQTLVTLTKGFFMGRYEVKNIEWLAYMTNPPSGGDILDNDPQYNVTYYQRAASLGTSIGNLYPLATNYCHLRTVAELQQGLIPPGWRYRLPTEAEWEYACRAGSTTPFGIGSGQELRNDAVRQDAAFEGTAPYPTNLTAISPIHYGIFVDGFALKLRPPVGSFSANAFGLYDMHGNVAELCWDYLGGNLPGGAVTNLVGGDPLALAVLVGRGGSYSHFGTDCRSARRATFQHQIWGRTGLRVVLIPADVP
jgi:sulfatase modifying factor 1